MKQVSFVISKELVVIVINIYHLFTNDWNSKLNPVFVGKLGGADSNTLVSTSKSVLHPWYGNEPVASSTNVIPKDQTSARISYSGFFGSGSIRSGCNQSTYYL